MSEETTQRETSAEEPSTLSEYLKGDCPASKYLKRLEALGAPGESERGLAAELCSSDPSLISRAVELARLASDEKNDARLRSAIKAWSSEIIRSQHPKLQDWGRVPQLSPDGDLSLLAKHLREVRKQGDKDAITPAEQLLRLALVVVSTRPDFDVVTALSAVNAALNSGQQDRNSLSRRIRQLALRTSPTLLESLAELTRLVRFETDPLRAEVAELKSKLLSATDRVHELRTKCEKQAAEIERLERSNEDLRLTLGRAERKIDGVMGGADQDMLELRARIRSFLNRKLRPNLDEAQGGLDHDPPNIEVAKHRLGVAGREIGRELEWLNQFSD